MAGDNSIQALPEPSTKESTAHGRKNSTGTRKKNENSNKLLVLDVVVVMPGTKQAVCLMCQLGMARHCSQALTPNPEC